MESKGPLSAGARDLGKKFKKNLLSLIGCKDAGVDELLSSELKSRKNLSVYHALCIFS